MWHCVALVLAKGLEKRHVCQWYVKITAKTFVMLLVHHFQCLCSTYVLM